MILRFTILFALVSTLVKAEENPFDCHVTLDKLSYDLTKLNGEQTVTWSVEAPPSTNQETLRFNLCDDLKKLDKVPQEDDCPSGTRACLTTTNKKADQPDRIIHVAQIAQTSSLKPEYSSLSSPKGLSLTLHGASYPSRIDPKANNTQALEVSLLCASEGEEASPTFVSYDSSKVKIEWKHSAGCGFEQTEQPPKQDDDKKDDDKKDEGNPTSEGVGSGINFFLLVILLAFTAYFGIGAYYNYTTYGARGIDLIPHRDFWQEVPYMFRDIFSHLCTSFRSRRTAANRGGYIAV
jgi:hypothetical protein